MEIRRIARGEGDVVGKLWDCMCRELVDGGPLTERGLAELSRMLDMSAWHRDAFCLVAVVDSTIVGFVNGRVDTGDGLLPGMSGEIDSLYVVAGHRGSGISRALTEAAVAWLRDRGAAPIRYLSCAQAHDDHRFWVGLGFEPDMICLSLYSSE